MDFNLKDKIVVVTAGTSNIGRAIALEFAQEGARLLVVGRDEQAGQAVVEQSLTAGAAEAHFAAIDLCAASCGEAVLAAAKKLGPVAVLVNGLGGNADQGFFVESDPALWQDDIDLNFVSLLRVTHALLPQMIAQGEGAIVNIGSTAALVGDYMLPVYSALKGAVHSFTKVLAKEVGQHGIRVNAIAPYGTLSNDPADYSRGSRFHPDNNFFAGIGDLSESDRAMRSRRTLVGKPFAVPTEISALAVYLASPRASFVTGQVWAIDGGSLL